MVKKVSPIGSFIDSWDGDHQYKDGVDIDNADIDVIYEEPIPSTTILPIKEKDGIPDKRTRYKNGEKVVFKCSFCSDYLGVGKSTNHPDIDEEKIMCYTCNRAFDVKGYIRNSNNPLWQQQKGKAKEYNEAIKDYIQKNQVKIVDL